MLCWCLFFLPFRGSDILYCIIMCNDELEKHSLFKKSEMQNSNLKKTKLSKTTKDPNHPEPTAWRKYESWGQQPAYLQISGDSSEPSGQSFSPSQRQPLEIQVTWSLHTNCLELQVLGWSSAFGTERKARKNWCVITLNNYCWKTF